MDVLRKWKRDIKARRVAQKMRNETKWLKSRFKIAITNRVLFILNQFENGEWRMRKIIGKRKCWERINMKEESERVYSDMPDDGLSEIKSMKCLWCSVTDTKSNLSIYTNRNYDKKAIKSLDAQLICTRNNKCITKGQRIYKTIVTKNQTKQANNCN